MLCCGTAHDITRLYGCKHVFWSYSQSADQHKLSALAMVEPSLHIGNVKTVSTLLPRSFAVENMQWLGGDLSEHVP